MVSLKENAGTVITRDKRRAAGLHTRICPSNHGKHKSLQRAPWGRKSFASSSQCCARPSPPLQGGTDVSVTPYSQNSRGVLCFKLACASSHSALPTGHPKHHPACPNFPAGLRQRRAFGSCVGELCQEGWAGSIPSQPRSGKEKQSRAHSVQALSLLLLSCDFTPYCRSTPCPHFFYSTMTPDSPRRSSLPARAVRQQFN